MPWFMQDVSKVLLLTYAINALRNVIIVSLNS